MGVTLVIAGDHEEYVRWCFDRPHVVSVSREIRGPDDLEGIATEDVDDVVLLAQYQRNPAWDSDEYRMLMEDGQSYGKAWARTVEEDWKRVNEPATPEKMAEARERLKAVAAELEEDA